MPPRNCSQDDVLIGVIVGAHGVAGEVKVIPQSDFPERFAQLETVFVKQGNQARPLAVTESRCHPGRGQVILRFEGIDDREAAAALRGAEVYIPVSQLMPLAEGQYYQFQVLGLEVVTTTGKSLGRVTEILRTGANDIYVTECALIPALDSVVKQIDPERSRILIEPMAGLLD